MSESRKSAPGAGRRFATGCAAAAVACVWTHALAGLLRNLGAEDGPLAAAALTVAALALGGSMGALLPSRVRAAVAATIGAASGLVAAIGIDLADSGAWAGALALPVVLAVTAPAALWVAPRWPARLDRLFARRRKLASVWALAALVGIVQLGRLATFMTDPSTDFVLTTRNPFWYKHQCLNAYLHGAELAERGVPDLYDPEHYPALNPGAAPVTRVEGMTVEDPYQYPPQFLLLPKAALALTHDYDTLRVVWFALQMTFFAAVYVLLALWVGGRAGDVALGALPVLLGAFPFLHNFQFGQFHLAAVALAVGGMLSFSAKRRGLGGLMLASSILSKMFPAVLVLVLLAQRRFRDLAWTVGWGGAITVLALVVLGPAPFTAFVSEHLPRLSDGSAFAFDEAWPEIAELAIVDNQGVFGLAMKMGLDKPAAAAANRVFTLAVLALAFSVGLRTKRASRWGRAASWLALVGVASMSSPGAWGDYTPVTALWLVAIAAAAAHDDRRRGLALGVIALFQYFLLGTMPIGEWAPVGWMIPVAAMGAAMLLVLYVGVALGHERLSEAAAAQAPRPLRRAA